MSVSFKNNNSIDDDNFAEELNINDFDSSEEGSFAENADVDILVDQKLLEFLEKKTFEIFNESETLEYLELTIEKAILVNVKIFEKDYEIKSDKPNLVHFLANKINIEAENLKKINPYFNQGQFNWAVQTAFQLCVKYYQEEKKYNFFIIENKKKLDSLINKITENLKKLS